MKPVKSVSSVNMSPSAPPVTNVLSAVESLAVGARLQKFRQIWAQKGLSPRVILILKDGYNLPFKIKPTLTRVPDKERICQSPQEQLPESGIAFPPSKTSGEKGQNTILSGILQPTFHCPQTKPKMAIKESGSLHWTSGMPTFTSLSAQSQGSSSGSITRAKLSNFGPSPLVSTAPMDFTIVVKEVKLIAQTRSIRMHQYLDN